MATELEDGAALVSAGLAAAEIDKLGVPPRAARAAGGSCANCGAALAGAYCHACGQCAHLHRSLGHMAEEVLHNVLHFEAKGWRTLPLLIVRPGALTRRYIDGQRVRYVSPLALFLFMVFLLFFVISLTDAEPGSTRQPGGASAAERARTLAELKQGVQESQREVRQAERELDKARRESENVPAAGAALAAAQAAQTAAETALARFGDSLHEAAAADKAPHGDAAPGAVAPPAAPAPASGNVAVMAGGSDWRAALARQQIDTGDARLDATLRRQLNNPDLFLYKFKSAASKFSFLLIPMSLPFLWLMFLGHREVTVYDHAVFSMYSLAFMSLLFSAVVLVALAGAPGPAVAALLLVPPAHMFMQLRGTYRLGVGAALWRTLALLGSAGTAFLVFLVLMVVAAAR